MFQPVTIKQNLILIQKSVPGNSPIEENDEMNAWIRFEGRLPEAQKGLQL